MKLPIKPRATKPPTGPSTTQISKRAAHCKLHLAGFKVPRHVIFGEVPKTSTGKIEKFALRQQAGSQSAINV